MCSIYNSELQENIRVIMHNIATDRLVQLQLQYAHQMVNYWQDDRDLEEEW